MALPLFNTDTPVINTVMNPIIEKVNENETEIGDLSTLATTEKTNLVGAINEVDSAIRQNASDLNTHKAHSVLDAVGVHGLKIEKGTFTPFLVGSITAGTNTYAKQKGFYYRIGNIVTCDIFIVLAAKDSAMGGSVSIGGLPFVSNSTADKISVASIGNFSFVDIPSGNTQFSAQISNGATKLDLQFLGNNIASSLVQSTHFKNNSVVICSISYEV